MGPYRQGIHYRGETAKAPVTCVIENAHPDDLQKAFAMAAWSSAA